MKKIFSFCFLLAISVITNAQVTRNGADSVKQVAATIAELVKPPIDSNILIVVDGIMIGTIRDLKKDIHKAFPADIIHSIEILKGYRATEKYGDKGKAGVLEFYLKEAKVIGEEKRIVADSIYSKVDIEAGFHGGSQAWRNFLMKNLNPNVPANNSAPEGNYTVMVQFIVDQNGIISEIKPLTHHGYGMEEEAMRVISKGPNGVPAIYNGKNVKAYHKQPITFVIAGEDWYKLSTTKIPAGKATLVEIKEMDYVKDEEIEVTVSSGTITHDSGKKYFITVDKPGKVFLKVSRKAKKKKDQFDYGTVEITVE